MQNRIKVILAIFLLIAKIEAQLTNSQIPKNWPKNRPYWDMPVSQDQDKILSLSKSNNTLDYQFNPFHQSSEIYGKETCHGGGSYDNSVIDQNDINAAQTGTNHFALDVTGNNIINAEDATEIQGYVDGTKPILQGHWNFLNKDEKLDWFTKMANIYTVDQKNYINGDDETRYISGNFATEFALRMNGYNKELTDLIGEQRKDIPSKYNESFEFNGRGNIPVYFVNRVRFDENGNVLGGHGMNAIFIGNNPLDFTDWIWYEPQTNEIIKPGDSGGSIPFNSDINIHKLENFGGSSWGEDMPSPYLGSAPWVNPTSFIKFDIDSNGNSSVSWYNDKLMLTKPSVSIDVNTDNSIPFSFKLSQNFPNPFNPTTIISYNLDKSANIELNIYNINGQLVDNIDIGYMNAGHHRNQYNGEKLPTGTYFYQLNLDGALSKPMKMTVLK